MVGAGGKAGRGTWKRGFSDTSSCKMCDGIYVLFVRTTTRIEGEYRSSAVTRIIHIKVLLDKNIGERGRERKEGEKKEYIWEKKIVSRLHVNHSVSTEMIDRVGMHM